MQRKLDWLSPISEQSDNYGNVYINMKFDDGTIASKGGKPADMAQHYADLLAIHMAGDLVEIELEDTGKVTQKGAKKYKLVGYPGWSAPVAQGGKAQANASNNSHDKDESIARAVALKAAVRFFDKELDDEDVLDIANRFYAWLVRGEGQQDATVPTPERPSDPIPVPTSASSGNHGEGAGSADESEGVEVSSGGPRASTPEDADSPWAGMGVD
jgi:hypothetical protein